MQSHVEDATLWRVTGLEILTFLGGCFLLGAGALAAVVFVSERRKHIFIEAVAAHLAKVEDVESGDVERPLSFTLKGTRVRAVVRGDVEVWQLERVDVQIFTSAATGAFAGPFAIVENAWHAPDVRTMASVDALTPRLAVYSRDERGARGLLCRARADLCSVLGRRTRRCVVGPGRAFLEVTRRGLAVEELEDALMRLEALLAVVAGEAPRLLPMPTAARAVAGPAGALVPC